MLPSAEEGGDPTDELSMMMMMLVVMDEIDYGYKWYSLIPFENILSSRDLFPLFENQLLQRNSTDSLSIRACSYIRLSMSCEYTPVLSCALLIINCAESEASGTLDSFFIDIDE